MTTPVFPVDPASVQVLLGDDPAALAAAAVAHVSALAAAYTRGNGFSGGSPTSLELASVITTAAARLAANGAQLARTDTAGPFSRQVAAGFSGWTLAEQAVLNRYRKRAG